MDSLGFGIVVEDKHSELPCSSLELQFGVCHTCKFYCVTGVDVNQRILKKKIVRHLTHTTVNFFLANDYHMVWCD